MTSTSWSEGRETEIRGALPADKFTRVRKGDAIDARTERG